MRLRKVVLAVIAAAALPALAPAGAAAHGHGRISIYTPREISAGEPVVAFGRLVCPRRANEAGQTVQLFVHSVGSTGYTPLGSTTTDMRGHYELTQTGVVFNSLLYVRSRATRSGRRAVRVEPAVTLNGPPEGSQLFTGEPETFSGTVSPADAGARVILQRQNALAGNGWNRIDAGVVNAAGQFTIVHRFVYPGSANIRVLVRSQGRNVPGLSTALPYSISQAQNPALTIAASLNPITFGQAVTVSGTLMGGSPATQVTLLAHTDQQSFAPVAQATPGAGGSFAFPAQVPVNSTFYEITGGGKTSAVLYEGVKDVLTAAVSQTSIQAGQTLTFSGAVAPAHPGHIIYLERQNASGNGFHVSQIATVGGGSTYAIMHTVYDPGTDVFRIKIPGGPENEGTVSQPFTIQVTPAPAAALRPEAPGNTSTPSAGSVTGTEGNENASGGNENPHHRR